VRGNDAPNVQLSDTKVTQNPSGVKNDFKEQGTREPVLVSYKEKAGVVETLRAIAP